MLDIEIVSTCIVIPPGYTLTLNVRGCNYDYDYGLGDANLEDPQDRPPEVFNDENTLHFKASREPFLLLIIPPGEG